MRKKLASLIILLLLFSLATSSFTVEVFIAGKLLSSDVEARIIENRTIVPIATLAKALDAKSFWDEESRTVTLTRGKDEMKLWIGQSFAQVNGQRINLDLPAQIIEDRTMVPISFVATAFDEAVGWHGPSKSVFIRSYPVSRIIDGDTIKIIYNGREESVRLIGIDTPESVHPDSSKNLPEGQLASDFTRRALEGKEIFLEFDVSERDRYGRLLAYVWTEEGMFNRTLLEAGMATAYTYPPDVKYSKEFHQLEKEARQKQTGLWQ